MKVQLGQALLPVLVQAGKLLVGFMKLIRPLTKNAVLFKIAVAGLAAAFVAYKIAMIAATIATTVFETSAAPVVAITLAVVAAVALLALGIYELWKHCKTFRDIVKATWSWIKANWPMLLGIIVDPIRAAIAIVTQAFGTAKQAALEVWNWVKSNWPYLVAALGGPFAVAAVAIVKHFGQIKQAALTVVSTVKGAIEDLVSYVESLPSKIGGILGNLPGVKQARGIFHSVGGLLHRQYGGPIPLGRTALVGERGPELVTALAGRLSVTPLPVTAPEPFGPGSALRPIEVTVPVLLDGREIARSTARVTANQLARR